MLSALPIDVDKSTRNARKSLYMSDPSVRLGVSHPISETDHHHLQGLRKAKDLKIE